MGGLAYTIHINKPQRHEVRWELGTGNWEVVLHRRSPEERGKTGRGMWGCGERRDMGKGGRREQWEWEVVRAPAQPACGT